MDFIEANCLLFEDTEENKFEYTKVHQEFTGLTALLLETMIDEVGITESQLEKCIIRGLRREKDAKIFKQVLLCDDFVSFKKVMVQKNKELEVEALRKIQENASADSTPTLIQRSSRSRHSMPSTPKSSNASKSKKQSPCPWPLRRRPPSPKRTRS